MGKNANDLNLTAEGFLQDIERWDPRIAAKIAQNEGLSLNDDHWTVLLAIRNFYLQFHLHPALRILIKQLAETWPCEKAQSIYLHQLFPGGPIKQASKIAGLPKPLKCL